MGINKIHTKDTLSKTIIEKLKKINDISFAELSLIPGFNGNEVLYGFNGETYTVLWAEFSKEAITAITDLEHAGIIQTDPAHILDYIIDGITLDLPLTDDGTHITWTPSFINKGEKWSN